MISSCCPINYQSPSTTTEITLSSSTLLPDQTIARSISVTYNRNQLSEHVARRSLISSCRIKQSSDESPLTTAENFGSNNRLKQRKSILQTQDPDSDARQQQRKNQISKHKLCNLEAIRRLFHFRFVVRILKSKLED